MNSAEAEHCWLTIQRLLQRTSDHQVLLALAATPLQRLIECSGTLYFDSIEREAVGNPAFCRLLSSMCDCAPTELRMRLGEITAKHSQAGRGPAGLRCALARGSALRALNRDFDAPNLQS